MQLDDFTHQVHDQLTAAAALGDDRTREIAAALATTARSSVRMAILDALAAATTEITDALYDAGDGQASPAVTVQLDGADTARFSVNGPPPEPVDSVPLSKSDDGEATARISLRLSDNLKADIEKAAGQAEISVNSWLIRAASLALRSDPAAASPWPGQHSGRGAQRITGWVTG